MSAAERAIRTSVPEPAIRTSVPEPAIRTSVREPAIEVRGLRKSYGTQVVLDGIDLDVAEGSVFALLGPNGAGKTTTVHILATLIRADAGEVRIGGHDVLRDPTAVRGLIGLTGQVSAV